MSPLAARSFDRLMTLGDVAEGLRRNLRGHLAAVALVLAAESAVLWFTQSPGMLAYALIALGTWIALAVWSGRGIGLPMLPVFVLQHFATFALPIIVDHEVLRTYAPEVLTRAGVEVLVFSLSLTLSWRIFMATLVPGSAYSHALQGFQKDDLPRLSQLGFMLVAASTAFQLIQATELNSLIYSALPLGSYPIVNAVSSGVGTCGFFLISMLVGPGDLAPERQALFWLLLAVNCLMIAAGFLLSAAAITVGAVFIGLLWSTGRIPWKFLIVIMLLFGYFNLGKFVMRERYWQAEEGAARAQLPLGRLPAVYLEWTQASWDIITGTADPDAAQRQKKSADSTKSGQSLLDRINNLQNLLYVIDAMDNGHMTPLHGETYALIPPLLVPRIFWNDKPRAHEGQVILNVHFGRQDLTSTYETYIAWGLLAEAYGNFGALSGPIILGVFLGWLCAWLEIFTVRKLVLSLEGFICFTVFLCVINSYEMVASVLVTSTFQAIIPIWLTCLPFVEKQRLRRPNEP